MRCGSLFSGIGGFDLGLERAGHTVVWQVEQDEFCRKVLAKHWPNVTRYEDVHDVGRLNLPHVDLICGGFPCQPVSLTGKGLAQADERWLWPEFARIIRELRPAYVLLENVPGLLVRGFGDVLGDLAALGYDAEWFVLSAADMGAPHLRRRAFVVAHANGAGLGEQRRAEPASPEHATPERCGEGVADTEGERQREGRPGRVAAHGERGRDTTREPLADADGWGREVEREPELAGLESARGYEPDGRGTNRQLHDAEDTGCGWWSTEPDVGRVAHGVPARVDRLRALGNAVVPQVAEWIGRRLAGSVSGGRAVD